MTIMMMMMKMAMMVMICGGDEEYDDDDDGDDDDDDDAFIDRWVVGSINGSTDISMARSMDRLMDLSTA